MKTSLIGSSECLEAPIQYSLLTSVAEDGTEHYGVLVEYLDEEAAIPSITSSLEDAQELIALMISGGVTPISSHDVVQDWILR